MTTRVETILPGGYVLRSRDVATQSEIVLAIANNRFLKLVDGLHSSDIYTAKQRKNLADTKPEQTLFPQTEPAVYATSLRGLRYRIKRL